MTRPSAFRAARPIIWISDVSERNSPSLSASEDRNERYLGQVDSLAQQVYSDKHVVYSGAQAAQKLGPLHRFHAVVDVLDLHAARVEIFREILCHLFRKSGDEGALSLLRAAEHLPDEIVHLCRHGAHLDHRIEKSRRADYLLDDLTGAASLVFRGGRGYRDGLTELLLEFLEEERAVVVCRGQAEAVTTRFFFLARSPPLMPRTCGTVTWLSSMKVMKSFGK